MKHWVHVLLLACVGLLSGLISYLLTSHQPASSIGIRPIPFYEPGLVFGFVIGFYFWSIRRQTLSNSIVFSIASAGSYAVAAQIAIYIAYLTAPVFMIYLPICFIVGLLIGGFVGTRLLLLSFNRFIHPIPPHRSFFILCIGSLLGLLYFFGPSVDDPQIDTPLIVLLVIWQSSIAAALGHATYPLEAINTRKPVSQKLLVFALMVLCILIASVLKHLQYSLSMLV